MQFELNFIRIQHQTCNKYLVTYIFCKRVHVTNIYMYLLHVFFYKKYNFTHERLEGYKFHLLRFYFVHKVSEYEIKPLGVIASLY